MTPRTAQFDVAQPDRGERRQPRLAIIATHPIQYYAPLCRAIAQTKELQLCVFFCSRLGLDPYLDGDFGRTFRWHNDLTSGYHHVFLDDNPMPNSTSLKWIDNKNVGSALESFRPDCVLIQGYSTRTMLRALRWANRQRVPVALFADSAFPDHVPFPKSLIKRLVLAYLYRRIFGFFYMGDRGRAYHRHYGAPADRLYFCPYTIDEPLFDISRLRRESLRKKVRGEFGLLDTDLAFLFCGKLIDRKRPLDLIHGAARLQKRMPAGGTVHLLFCGDGKLHREIETAARASNVRATLLGFRNIDAIGEVYCAADAMILPSEREPFGVVLAEAAFFDLPLIVSDRIGAIGPNSLVRDGQNGIVFPVGDHDKLSEAMAAMHDPARRTAMGASSRAIYELQSVAVCARNVATSVNALVKMWRSHR
jgi:glycosyltransferase involved in cell wall biosynthesis